MYGGGGGGGGYSGGRGGSSFRDCENVGPGDFGSWSNNIKYCKEHSAGFPSGGSGGGGGSFIADPATEKRKEKGIRLGNGYVKIDYIPS